MSEMKRIEDGLVAECDEDFVGLWEFLWRLKRTFPNSTDQDVRLMTIQLVRSLMHERGILAGNIIDGEFRQWGLDLEPTIARIQHEWDALGREPTIGDIVWFVADEYSVSR